MTKRERPKTKQVVCKYCNNSFNTYSFSTQMFCSKKCFSDYKQSLRPTVNCKVCGKEFKPIQSRKDRNNNQYCSRECYNKRRSENIIKLKRGTLFFDNLLEAGKCASCNEDRKFLLHIHHKDGNKHNNDMENLEIVCGNCHMIRHLKKNKKNQYCYHPRSLTNRDLIKTFYSSGNE